MSLTSVKYPADIVRTHFIDSLAIARFLSPGRRLIDVGSGGGFPGIALTIVFPQKEVFLVESRRKKANFLREAIRTLKLENTKVIEGRAEQIRLAHENFFHEAVTRAFGSLEFFLRISAPLLVPNGESLVMHGPKGEDLFHQISNQWERFGFSQARLERYSLPLDGEKRTLLIFTKS